MDSLPFDSRRLRLRRRNLPIQPGLAKPNATPRGQVVGPGSALPNATWAGNDSVPAHGNGAAAKGSAVNGNGVSYDNGAARGNGAHAKYAQAVTPALYPATWFAGRRVVILGLARQGLALARFFAASGANVTVSDLAPAAALSAEIAALEGLPVTLVLGEHPHTLLDGCDLLCLSGGVPPQTPFVAEARARGIPLSNDSLLTFQMSKALGLGPRVGITGSSGKTTTTTLAGEMLAASGVAAHVGGNIGAPLLDRLHAIHPHEPLVLELSSFQLELFDPALAWGDFAELGPDVAGLLNITPNHLDRHASMSEYAAAKLNLLRHMPPDGTVVLNLDDPVTAALAPEWVCGEHFQPPAAWELEPLLAEVRAQIGAARLRVVGYSRELRLGRGAWLDGDTLMLGQTPICRRSEIQLRGDHNISNMLAAAAISRAAGASLEGIRQVATAFAGVAHRLEVVARHNGVTWINDSIATSPERALAGLRSFPPGEETIILLAGGKDKNLPWDTFAQEAPGRVSFLIGFGQSGPMIVNVVQERARYSRQTAPNCAVVRRLDEAVELAARIARPHSIVLLSPGGASYDAYKNFEARGEHFRQLVQQVIDAATPVHANGGHTNGSQGHAP